MVPDIKAAVRLDAFRKRTGESFRPFRAHAKFKSGFQTNDSSYEIFYVVVLLDTVALSCSTLSASLIVVAKASHTRSVHPMLILSEMPPWRVVGYVVQIPPQD